MTRSTEDLLRQAYAAFNARDIDAALSLMSADVKWPNGMEGGVVHGHSGVRDYWTRQWGVINPTVEPLNIKTEPDGRFNVEVRQIVKDLKGAILVDRTVHHVYQLRDGLISSMEIQE
jgi:ketosteroid isomerase-like protein